MTLTEYLKAQYPNPQPEPKFRMGQSVRFVSKNLKGGKTRKGSGTITNVWAAYGNMPTNYAVDTFAGGVLFEYEVEAA